MATKKTETSIEQQARVFALVHFQKVDNRGLVDLMNRVSKARNWRGAVAKRFRMAVVDATQALRAQKAGR